MIILEFDKSKQLLTPWPNTVYGDISNLQMEFDLPISPCFENITSISFSIFKKGEVSDTNTPLISTNNFNVFDESTWSGTVLFNSSTLLDYIQSASSPWVYCDGQFTFNVNSNKTIKSQIFSLKIFKSIIPVPPEPEYPTKDEMNQAINDGIDIHNTSLDAHTNLLINYATKDYVNNVISLGEKINETPQVDFTSLENHYTYNPNIGIWIFDTKTNGSIIRLNAISAAITDLNLTFENNIDGKNIDVFLTKTSPLNVNLFDNGNITNILFNNQTPAGLYLLRFNILGNTVKYINTFKIR